MMRTARQLTDNIAEKRNSLPTDSCAPDVAVLLHHSNDVMILISRSNVCMA